MDETKDFEFTFFPSSFSQTLSRINTRNGIDREWERNKSKLKITNTEEFVQVKEEPIKETLIKTDTDPK